MSPTSPNPSWVVVDQEGRPAIGETLRSARTQWTSRAQGGGAGTRLALGAVMVFLALFLLALGIVTAVIGVFDLVLSLFRRR
jgi:hypothetical protein